MLYKLNHLTSIHERDTLKEKKSILCGKPWGEHLLLTSDWEV